MTKQMIPCVELGSDANFAIMAYDTKTSSFLVVLMKSSICIVHEMLNGPLVLILMLVAGCVC